MFRQDEAKSVGLAFLRLATPAVRRDYAARETLGAEYLEAGCTRCLLHGLEDVDDDLLHVPDHAEDEEKEKREHHEADREAHLHPVSFLGSHHADSVVPKRRDRKDDPGARLP